jgi:aminoglycoside-2''-adenylyltransferase
MTPPEVAELLAGVPCRWWIAGGWAIDLHLGRQTRDHADMDVLILRDDQLVMQEALEDWDLNAADPPGTLRPWPNGEVLPARVHDTWCRRDPTSAWTLQIMIDDSTDGMWTYRRDARIQRPVRELASNSDRRVLAPEVQLLQKSKNPRPKDEADFLATHALLTGPQREWLAWALGLVSPAHPWLAML